MRSAMIVPMRVGRGHARRDHVRRPPTAAGGSTTTTSRSRRTSRCARRPPSRTPACTPRSGASRTRCRPACCPTRSPRSPASRSPPPTRRGSWARTWAATSTTSSRRPTGGHLVFLGDVTGKGIDAAALTSLVRHSIRTAARFDPRPERDPAAGQRDPGRAARARPGDARDAADRGRPASRSPPPGTRRRCLRRDGDAVTPIGPGGILLGVAPTQAFEQHDPAAHRATPSSSTPTASPTRPAPTTASATTRLAETLAHAPDDPARSSQTIEQSAQGLPGRHRDRRPRAARPAPTADYDPRRCHPHHPRPEPGPPARSRSRSSPAGAWRPMPSA